MFTPSGIGAGLHASIDTNKESDRLKDMIVIRNATTKILSQILARFESDAKIAITEETLTKYFHSEEGKKFKENTKDADLKMAISQLTTYLSAYNGIDATAENKAKIVAELSEAYSLAYGNQQAQNLNNKKGLFGTGYYLSGGSLSVGFFAGIIPVVGSLKFRQHKYNGSVDSTRSIDNAQKLMYGKEYNREVEGNSLDDKLINLNALLEKDAVTLDGNNLVIDTNTLGNYQIKIDPSMKGNIVMKKGKMMVHKSTPIRLAQFTGVNGKVDVLNIGAETTAYNALSVRDLSKDDVIESVDKLQPRLEEVSEKKFKSLLEALKKKAGESFPKELENLTLEYVQVYFRGTNLNDLSKKNLKISSDGDLSLVDRKKGQNFEIILETLQNKTEKAELLLGDTVKATINTLYTNLSNLKTNALANIAHKRAGGRLAKRYDTWNGDKKSENMVALLKEMQRYIDNNEPGNQSQLFDGVIAVLNTPETPENQKNQILTAIDGIFSRTYNVKGTGDGQYQLEFGTLSGKESFGQIIDDTKGRIIRKMAKEQSFPTAKYGELFDAMNTAAKGKIENKITSSVREGAIGYNFGNPHDVVRPILNPHVVNGVDTLGADKIPHEVKNHLLKELFTTDSALVDNILNSIVKTTEKSKDEIKNLIKNQEDLLNNGLDI